MAAERKKNREELLEATEKELDKIVAATSTKARPLKGEDKIGVKVGRAYISAGLISFWNHW